MQAIGSLIILASFAAFILGVVNVIRPQAWMKVQKRLVGLFIILGSMAGCVAGGSMMPPAPATTEATINVEKGEAAAAPEQAPKKDGLTQAEFNAMWSEMKAVLASCDNAVSGAQASMKTGDVYKAYPRIQRAAEVCGKASLAAYSVDVPRSAKGEVRKKLTKGREICQMSIVSKQIAMESVAKVANGDSRPSAVSKAQEDMERGSTGAMACAVGFMAAANEAGLTLPEIEEAAAKSQ